MRFRFEQFGITPELVIECAKHIVARDENGGSWLRREIPDCIRMVGRLMRVEDDGIWVHMVCQWVPAWSMEILVAREGGHGLV